VNAEDSKFGNMNTEYPQPVEEALVDWQEALDDPEFLKEQDIKPSYAKEATRAVFGPALLEQWLKTGEAIVPESIAEHLIKKFIVEAIFAELKDMGYVDSIEDERGEEVFWATPKGKEYRKSIN